MCGLFLINSVADLLVFYRVPIPHHIQVIGNISSTPPHIGTAQSLNYEIAIPPHNTSNTLKSLRDPLQCLKTPQYFKAL